MSCDAQTLVNEANCIQCGVPRGLMLPVMIVQAARIAGISTDPATLMALAKCDECGIPVGMQWPVLIALACNIAGGAGGGGGLTPATCPDPDATAFLTTAGISDTTTVNAICALVTSLKAAGVWTLMDAIYPFVGGTSFTNSFNLKNPSAFQITWHGTVAFSQAGVTGDGSTGYGDTGFNPATAGGNYALNSCCFGINNANAAGTGNVLSIQNGTSIWSTLAVAAGIGQCLGNNNANGTLVTPASSVGLLVSSRTSPASYTLYGPGGTTSTSSTAGTGLLSLNFPVLALNGSGVISAWSNTTLSFAFIGGGFTPTQVAAIQTAVSTFNAAFPRN